jgi:multimeric flavodoxin WrbA
MQAIYPHFVSADGIIIGSPVYFWSVTGQAKLLMDRTYALRYPTFQLEGNVGGAIAIAGKRGQVHTLAQINTFFFRATNDS